MANSTNIPDWLTPGSPVVVVVDDGWVTHAVETSVQYVHPGTKIVHVISGYCFGWDTMHDREGIPTLTASNFFGGQTLTLLPASSAPAKAAIMSDLRDGALKRVDHAISEWTPHRHQVARTTSDRAGDLDERTLALIWELESAVAALRKVLTAR